MARAVTDIRSLARQHTRLAINTLAGIARNGESEPARVAAAEALLSRGWGKAPATLAVDGEIKITLRKMLTEDDDDGELIDVTPERVKIEQE